jgi:hypothetical protein
MTPLPSSRVSPAAFATPIRIESIDRFCLSPLIKSYIITTVSPNGKAIRQVFDTALAS